LRIRATIDTEGYVSKDIFLLGHLTDIGKELKLSLELMLGILNSELNSYLYDLMFAGTEIMGKYLHYLPTFLHDIPVILPNMEEKMLLEQKVTEILREKSEQQIKKLDQEIDDLVFDIYRINADERAIISSHIKEHLKK
jgi:hypothetical protein